MKALIRIFVYLKKHENTRIVFNSKIPIIQDVKFNKEDWSEFYPDAQEEVSLPHAPRQRSPCVTLTPHLNTNHAGNVWI